MFDNTAYTVGDLEPMVDLFRGRVTQFVFTSSVAVYKRSFIQPVTESHATHAADDSDPRKGYGVGKVSCEQLPALDPRAATRRRCVSRTRSVRTARS